MSSLSKTENILRAYQDLGFIFNINGTLCGRYRRYQFSHIFDNRTVIKFFNKEYVNGIELYEEVLRYIQSVAPKSIQQIIPYILDGKIIITRAITPRVFDKVYTEEFEYSLSFRRSKESVDFNISVVSSFMPNSQNIEMYYRTILEFLEFQETNLLDPLEEKLVIKFDRNVEKDGERYELECHYGDKVFLFKSETFKNGLVQLFNAIRSPAPTPPDTFTFSLKATPIPRFFIRESEDDIVGLFQITNFDSSTMYGVTQRGGAVELRTHTKDVIVKMVPIHSFHVDESDANKWDISSFMLGKVFNPEHKYIILVNDKEKYEDSYLQGHRLFRLLSQNI